jgi:hypothetical protein
MMVFYPFVIETQLIKQPKMLGLIGNAGNFKN